MRSAFLLVSHGSRDPRPEVAMDQLVRLIADSPSQIAATNQQVGENSHSRSNTISIISNKHPLVDKACLELSPLSLAEQIIEFSDRAIAQGCNKIQIVPVFLLPGTHVKEDIPAQVAIAQQALGQNIALDLRPHLGTHPGLVRLLTTIRTSDIEAWILLSHGSRRLGAKEPVKAIAKQLNAVDAYWAIPPSLESRVHGLVAAGYQQIGILPYFLFAGGITDAIAQLVAQLQVHPSITLHLTEPIGASAELAGLIWDLVEK